LSKLRKVLNALAEEHDADDTWRWQEGQSLAAYVESLPDQPEYRRRVRAIQRQIMQAQRSSEFTPQAGEHHALKVCSYARFSSPMREIVGIFTHKELLEALSGRSFDATTSKQADEALREQVIQAANEAKQRQRKLDKKIELTTLQQVFKDDLEADDKRWHNGTIMGLRFGKLYINLDALALNIKVYVEDLETQWACNYELDDASATPHILEHGTAAPRWLLGDGVKLYIRAFDVSRQRLIFSMYPL
jgi:ribonuclease R